MAVRTRSEHGSPLAGQAGGRPPNLLVLMSDQQRADSLAPGSGFLMPNLSALASQGVMFERCYTSNAICSPSRASLMSGLLPHSHGMVDCTHTVEPYRADLKHGIPFWSQVLQRAGYRTGYFGKWHIERSERLEEFGFDEYELSGSPAWRGQRRDLGLDETRRRFASRIVVSQPGYQDMVLAGVAAEPPEATEERHLYSRGIDFVTSAARDRERPWFLMVSTRAPHDPYIALASHRERFAPDAIALPTSFDDPLEERPGIYRRIRTAWRNLSLDQVSEAIACYRAVCSQIDDQVGRILEALRATGQLEDTVIAFTSDHGDYLGAHGLFLKGVPAFEEAYRVPLVLAGPGIAKGVRNHHVVSLLDLPRTLVGLTTGGDFSCQGRSLMPMVGPGDEEKLPSWSDEAFAEFHGQRFFYTQRILWRDHVKYVFNGFDDDELYDLSTDPDEICNLAHRDTAQQLLRSMAARMWEIVMETDDFNLHQSHYGMFRFAPVGPLGTREAH